jgi:hypothetical protein
LSLYDSNNVLIGPVVTGDNRYQWYTLASGAGVGFNVNTGKVQNEGWVVFMNSSCSGTAYVLRNGWRNGERHTTPIDPVLDRVVNNSGQLTTETKIMLIDSSSPTITANAGTSVWYWDAIGGNYDSNSRACQSWVVSTTYSFLPLRLIGSVFDAPGPLSIR